MTFGAPHFMVKCPGQPAICFDYNLSSPTVELIADQGSKLSVLGHVGHETRRGRKFFVGFRVRSPNGIAYFCAAVSSLSQMAVMVILNIYVYIFINIL